MNRLLIPNVLLLLLFSFTTKPAETHTQATQEITQKVLKPEFQALIDSANLDGAILIFDGESKTFYSNDFAWSEKGQLPASTFKIPNAIIALETGVVENDSVLFEWDGEKRAFEVWEQDLIFRKAFQILHVFSLVLPQLVCLAISYHNQI